MPPPGHAHLPALLDRIPTGCFVLTAAYEDKRTGVIARSVQPCADEPVLLSVALRRGHGIEPLIRDSHAFAVCLINPQDRLLIHTFRETEHEENLEEPHDPFDAVGARALSTGSPILDRAIAAFDCEVVRHFDLEADHQLYIGQVVAACQGRAHNNP